MAIGQVQLEVWLIYIVIWAHKTKWIVVIYHSANLGGHKYCGTRNMIIIYSTILRDHVVTKSCGFMGGSLSW